MLSDDISGASVLGEGADARVILCKNQFGQIFATKRYHADRQQKMNCESGFLLELSTDANVVRILGVSAPNLLFLEYCPSTLAHLIKVPLADDVLISHVLTLVSTFRDMHRKGFFHLDIKPENILIRQDGTLAVADFSFAERKPLASKWHGTQVTAAPEMWRAHLNDKSRIPFTFNCEKADVFSLGATLIWLLNAAPLWPMARLDCTPLVYHPLYYSYVKEGVLPKQTPRNRLLCRLWPILRRMCRRNPDRRPSLDEVLRDIEDAQPLLPLAPVPAPTAAPAPAATAESPSVEEEVGSLGEVDTPTRPPPPIGEECLLFATNTHADESFSSSESEEDRTRW
ncbi:putative Protein kinase domain [Paratrimastix pyriformis]|uniref:Protein kinase domain-containing protein n=1 Tax=Paratrimastix pyriformis TaxID=342808 RepID=A0ABQ8UGQ0_9EUKA|nr:putative Protein kinase domain [Paratrimastix pyriformis]